MNMIKHILSLTYLSLLFEESISCTNILVTPKASSDGSSIIAYNADSPQLMGMLYHYPPQTNTDDESKMRQVYEWDTGNYLGEIIEADITYNVIGNTNEHGLVIAETTFGGLESLGKQPGAKIDYGSLIYITLQRAKTAKEAIRTMSNLTDTYGYASTGESFSIADRHGEVWIMEMIGRGEGASSSSKKKGAVWVAMRIPDGYVSSHANQARIRTFPRNDPDNCLYADDVVDFAVEMGLYDRQEGDDDDDSDFSFSDTYDPVDFESARHDDARVWSVFSAISQNEHFEHRYEDYASGKNLTNRMPLWIKPKTKLSFRDVITLMSNHYDGTSLEFDDDVGAGPYKAPYRPHPLIWDYQQKRYFNERSISTPKTGWNFIAQIRSWMPRELSSVLWFGVDDSATSPRYPVYGSSTAVSDAYGGVGPQDGVQQPLLKLDMTKAFWVQNMVSNLAYSRWYEIYPHVKEKIVKIEESFLYDLRHVDETAKKLHHEKGAAEAVEYVTDYSINAGDRLHKAWLKFYGELFVKYRDGYIITPKANEPSCGCNVSASGFSEEWKRRIANETGEKYRVPEGSDGGSDHSDTNVDDDDDVVRMTSREAMLRASVRSSGGSVLERKRMEQKARDKLTLKSLQ